MSSLVDPSTLEGKFLMPLPGDPTMRGRTIRSIDDVPLSIPFQTHGGRPYIDELGGYANAPGNAATAAGRVKKYQDKYDTDVLGAYMKMAPQSMDFSRHPGVCYRACSRKRRCQGSGDRDEPGDQGTYRPGEFSECEEPAARDVRGCAARRHA